MHSYSSMWEASTVTGPKIFFHLVYDSSLLLLCVSVLDVGLIRKYSSKYWSMTMAYPVHATPVSLITCNSKYWNITICTCTTSFTLVSLDTPHSAEWEEFHASLIPRPSDAELDGIGMKLVSSLSTHDSYATSDLTQQVRYCFLLPLFSLWQMRCRSEFDKIHLQIKYATLFLLRNANQNKKALEQGYTGPPNTLEPTKNKKQKKTCIKM